MVINDQTLLSYVDGSLTEDDRASVEAAISRSSELAARVAALRASEVPYRDAYDKLFTQPIPPELTSMVRTLVRGRITLDVPSSVASANDARFARARQRARICSRGAASRRGSPDRERAERGERTDRAEYDARGATTPEKPSFWWQVGGFTAGVVSVAVLVASAGARFLTEDPAPTPMPPGVVGVTGNLDVDGITVAPPEGPSAWHGSYEPWVRAFVSYQTLFARATLDPLDDEPSEAIATVRAIRSRDDIPMVVPDLRRAGMEFKRIQRLQFDNRAVVQMAYLPREGPPVSLYVVKDARLDHGPSAQTIPPMDTVTWRRDGQMFALVAPSGSSDLLPIARALANAVVPVLYDGGSTPPGMQAGNVLQPFTDAMADSPFSRTYESR